MKKFLLIMFLTCTCFALDYTLPKDLISSAHTLSASWTAVGSAIENPGLNSDGIFDLLGIITSATVNNSSNIRFRTRFSNTSTGTTKRTYVIKTVGTSEVKLEDLYYEFNDDADVDTVFEMSVLPFRYIWVEASVSAAGTTAASLDTVQYYMIKD